MRIISYASNGQLMYSHDGRNNRQTDYIYLGGSLLALREAPVGTTTTTVKYQHTDALGTPIATTNSAGAFEKSEYEPYGQLINRPITDGPGFTGHVQDAATGLTYMQQRYYDPGSLPKPPTGRGSVPAAERDPKRAFDPAAREAKRLEQGGACPGCGKKIDSSNSEGHHIKRHADGGPTSSENHAEVCTECHPKLHSKDQ